MNHKLAILSTVFLQDIDLLLVKNYIFLYLPPVITMLKMKAIAKL